jgi:glycosyltransferase involved in cell wall biosynthesis
VDSPLLFWLAALTAAALAAATVELTLAGRRLRSLHRVPPLPPEETPSVSVVIAARNEARAIEPALRSVLALEGREVEVVVVDDRSEDGTGEILERMAAGEPRLRVVRVDALPSGWLGKNHALRVGAEAARGELLLFTDADVVMRPDTLRRAAAYLREAGLDHLAVAPRLVLRGAVLQAFGIVFAILFSLFARPWKARDPRSRHHVGIGAFNLLRAEAYREIGTHRAIAMRPDDDMKLGKLVKKHGLRQDFAFGAGQVSVEWYGSVREAVHGLRKNAFAGVEYRLWAVAGSTVALLLLFVLPFPAALLATGWTRLLFALAAGLVLAMYAGTAREQGAPVWQAALFPVACLLFLAALWNSTLYTLRRGGIEWRGTHYALEALRANRV